jgi:Tfp pilus assembly protein PilP
MNEILCRGLMIAQCSSASGKEIKEFMQIELRRTAKRFFTQLPSTTTRSHMFNACHAVVEPKKMQSKYMNIVGRSRFTIQALIHHTKPAVIEESEVDRMQIFHRRCLLLGMLMNQGWLSGFIESVTETLFRVANGQLDLKQVSRLGSELS